MVRLKTVEVQNTVDDAAGCRNKERHLKHGAEVEISKGERVN